jgi:prepilin-type N-terminal cleavage/methylation domain-containing protein
MKTSKAFTVIELILVITIVGIMVTVGYQKFSKDKHNQESSTYTEYIEDEYPTEVSSTLQSEFTVVIYDEQWNETHRETFIAGHALVEKHKLTLSDKRKGNIIQIMYIKDENWKLIENKKY